MTRNATESRQLTILDAAAGLIAERGYHAVRVADIAAVAGTSTGTVHYYFPGKDDVLTAAKRDVRSSLPYHPSVSFESMRD